MRMFLPHVISFLRMPGRDLNGIVECVYVRGGMCLYTCVCGCVDYTNLVASGGWCSG